MAIGVPAYEQIRDILRDEIISGVIPPNTRLTILEVANRFGVSQVPVREAFQGLQGEGLIRVSAHKGAHVLSLNPDYVRDMYELRGLIEGLLARQSIPHMTPSDLAELNRIHKELGEAMKQNEWENILRLNKEFHKGIYRFSKNLEAQKIYEHYSGLIGTLRRKHGFLPMRLEKILEEHAAILDGLQAKDEDRVEKLTRIHAEMAMKDILELMRSDGKTSEGFNKGIVSISRNLASE